MGAFSAQEEFEAAIQPGLVSRQASGEWSRDRVYGLARTFWGFVWQAVHAHAPCRAVVRQIQTKTTKGQAVGFTLVDGKEAV